MIQCHKTYRFILVLIIKCHKQYPSFPEKGHLTHIFVSAPLQKLCNQHTKRWDAEVFECLPSTDEYEDF